MTGERIYRALLFLYPARFRREYRGPMLQLYRDARRDRSASWLQLSSDVLLSVPHQHKEAFMHASSRLKLGILAVVVTTAIVLFAVKGGAIIALLLMLLLAWTLAAWVKNSDRATPTQGMWWKLALSGVALFAILFGVFAPPWPESWRSSVDGEVAWAVGTIGFCLSIVLVVTGLLVGAAELSSRRRALH